MPLRVRPEPGRLERSRRKGMRLYQEGRSRKRPPLSICRSAPRVAGAGGRVARRLARIPRRSALRGVPTGRGGRHLMPRPQDRQITPGAPPHARFFGGALDGARRARPPRAQVRPWDRGLLRPPARGWRVRVGAFQVAAAWPARGTGRGAALSPPPAAGCV